MTDHASDEYLDGLSDLDRARAIVAVRWLDYRWQGCSKRWLGKYDPSNGIEVPSPSTPTCSRILFGLNENRWGTNWRGTASLMELAESKGWELHTAMRSSADGEWMCQLLRAPYDDNDFAQVYADTIHAAVLLACAAAAQREESK